MSHKYRCEKTHCGARIYGFSVKLRMSPNSQLEVLVYLDGSDGLAVDARNVGAGSSEASAGRRGS
jgi:hypothetical protein